MTLSRNIRELASNMADQVQNEAPPQVDIQTHARDWTRMTKMLKYGAIATFVIAMGVLVIISS